MLGIMDDITADTERHVECASSLILLHKKQAIRWYRRPFFKWQEKNHNRLKPLRHTLADSWCLQVKLANVRSYFSAAPPLILGDEQVAYRSDVCPPSLHFQNGTIYLSTIRIELNSQQQRKQIKCKICFYHKLSSFTSVILWQLIIFPYKQPTIPEW